MPSLAVWDIVYYLSFVVLINHSFIFLFCFLYFKIIFYWLYYYSCPSFSSFASLHQAPPSPSGNPHTIAHVHGSWVGSLAIPFPILYFISPWLLCNYLFILLNPHTSSPIPHNLLTSGNCQNTLHIHDSVSVLLVCLVCFLDSIVDRYVFIAILLFIVLIFYFCLSKSL